MLCFWYSKILTKIIFILGIKKIKVSYNAAKISKIWILYIWLSIENYSLQIEIFYCN